MSWRHYTERWSGDLAARVLPPRERIALHPALSHAATNGGSRRESMMIYGFWARLNPVIDRNYHRALGELARG